MVKKLFSESYLANSVKEAYFASFLYAFICWFKKNIVESRYVKFFFDTSIIAGIWYKSFFYRSSMYKIRKLSLNIPKPSLKFDASYIGLFIAFILLLPDQLWTGFVWIPVFTALAILYISHNIRGRVGTVFVLINLVLGLFLLVAFLGLPYGSVRPIAYLIFGIDIFFMISFALRTEEDIKKVLSILFVTAVVLCGMGFLQNNILNTPATAIYSDGIKMGEVLILVFPFVFMFPPDFGSKSRKYLYQAFIFILFFNVITATQSRAAFIGFWVEVAILILTNIRYLPFMIMLLPLGLNTILQNIGMLWQAAGRGDVAMNIISLFRQFWNYGFGISRDAVMSIYGTQGIIGPGTTYISLVSDVGAILLILFLAYILRLAHSTLTAMFSADKRYKEFFAAGFSVLIGISVASFVETTIFSSRTMLVYWIMLGILRAVRILKMGVYES